jgi:hypothetical protein
MKAVILCCLVSVCSLWGTPTLMDYKKNVYSQFGEDGIIEKIFEVIGTSSKIAIEFGAADGFILSNTARLWSTDPSWKAFLIESDDDFFQNLENNIANYPCTALHRKVGITSEDSLEAILEKYNLPPSIDLLSIDIDGNDYHIFKTLNFLHPRVIICEYNPTIPAHLDVYADYGNNIGCSVAALQRIAGEKGYSLVAITESNCFFVTNKDFPLFSDYETNPRNISMNRCIRYLITDYAGNYQLIGSSDFADPYDVHQSTNQTVRGNVTILPAPKETLR